MGWTRQSGQTWWLSLLLATMVAGCGTPPAKQTQQPAATPVEVVDPQVEIRRRFREALALKREGQLEEAERLFRELHEEAPTLSGPLANVCVIVYERDGPREAKPCFHKVLILDTSHADTLNYMGIIARHEGRFDDAESYFRRAVVARRDFQPAILNLAILLDLYQGRLKEALRLYEYYQSLQEEPGRPVSDWIFDLKNRM